MKNDGKEVYFTTDDQVQSTQNSDNAQLQPCNHEEADTRIFFHAENAANSGFNTFMIRTNDVDVLVLAIFHSVQHNRQIYVSFVT